MRVLPWLTRPMADSLASRVEWAALGLLALALVVQTARLFWVRTNPARRLRARVEQGLRGEVHAEALLREAGFRVVARQVPCGWSVWVDGERVEIALRIDLLVERDRRRYVVEVKTGRVAPSITNAPTRRQLLEYCHALEIDGILLVDADLGRIQEVSFALASSKTAPRSSMWIGWIAVGAAAGALAMWAARLP